MKWVYISFSLSVSSSLLYSAVTFSFFHLLGTIFNYIYGFIGKFNNFGDILSVPPALFTFVYQFLCELWSMLAQCP